MQYDFKQYKVMSGMKVDLSKQAFSSQLNGMFLWTRLRGMLEGKKYSELNLFFQFVLNMQRNGQIYPQMNLLR